MLTFLLGLILLIGGGIAYGAFCQRIFGPDDRQTPAVRLNDGIDFVPMNKWKNSLIQLLNIAGTGPILGPIRGFYLGRLPLLRFPLAVFWAVLFMTI